jgi:hypothetical protein
VFSASEARVNAAARPIRDTDVALSLAGGSAVLGVPRVAVELELGLAFAVRERVNRLGLCAALLIGCAGIPPSRVELAGSAHGGGSQSGSAQRLSFGASSASAMTRRDVPVDLAGGYIARKRDDRVQHGSFLELTARAWRRGRRRLWLGGRAEMFWNRNEQGDARAAGLVRAHVDITGTVSAGGGGRDVAAAAHGRFGVGAFVAAGPEVFANGDVATTIHVGLAIRLPLLAVASSPRGGMLVW